VVVELIDVSTNGGWAVFVFFGLVFLLFLTFGVLGLVAPDQVWRMRHWWVRWQYRDGHRLEPSDAGRLWERIIGVGLLGAALAFAGWVGSQTIDWSAESRVEREIDGTATVYDLRAAAQTPGCAIRVIVCLRSDEVFPIEVTSYEASDTELRLRVGDEFFPTHAVVEEGQRVTVSLYGRCNPDSGDEPYGSSAADCAVDRRFGFILYGVVPVTLNGPLDGRTVVDGHTGQPIEPSQ
jgi:hypothetical protein